jgi:uncharacterized protein
LAVATAAGKKRQRAEGLAAKGIGSPRFDNVGAGTNMEHLDVLSLAHYVDEASLAFDFLAARPECAPVFLLGHSEGALHATAGGRHGALRSVSDAAIPGT